MVDHFLVFTEDALDGRWPLDPEADQDSVLRARALHIYIYIVCIGLITISDFMHVVLLTRTVAIVSTSDKALGPILKPSLKIFLFLFLFVLYSLLDSRILCDLLHVAGGFFFGLRPDC